MASSGQLSVAGRWTLTRSLWLVPIILLLLVGCVSTQSSLLDPKYEPVEPEHVRVFTTESELEDLDYVRIACIEATGSTGWTSQTGMIEAMRKKAGQLGGNGVLLPQIMEPSAGAKIAGAIFGTGSERKGNAIAVRVFGKKQPKQ